MHPPNKKRIAMPKCPDSGHCDSPIYANMQKHLTITLYHIISNFGQVNLGVIR